MRKRYLTLQDWGRIPTVTPQSSGYEDSKSLLARLQREEAEAKNAPIRKIESEITAALRENQTGVQKFWSLPMEEMGKYAPSEAPADHGLDLPERSAGETYTPEFLTNVYYKFYETLKAQGIELNENGYCRLQRYFLKTASERNLAITIEAWWSALARLNYLGCLTGEILTGEKLIPKPVKLEKGESSKAVIGDLLEQTPSESHVWKKAVDQGFEANVAEWLEAWAESLKKNFDYTLDLDKVGRRIGQLLDKMNWSPFSYQTWDRIRVCLVKSRDFPEHMLTPQEQLSELIESSDTNDYATRRRIGRLQQDLMDERPTLSPHK